MDIERYLRSDINLEEKIENLKLLYSNWLNTGCILYNSVSEIVVICSERGSTSLEKIQEIKEKALNVIDRANEIGLTNPDFYSTGDLSNNLIKMIDIVKNRMKNVKR